MQEHLIQESLPEVVVVTYQIQHWLRLRFKIEEPSLIPHEETTDVPHARTFVIPHEESSSISVYK